MKPKIKIYDSMFSHTPKGSFGCGDLNLPPTFFDWDRSDKRIGECCVITENSFFTVDSINYPIKIGILLEPPAINPDSYKWISQPENYSKFQYILTYNQELLTLDSRFKKMIFGGSWVHPSEQMIYPKTKNISIIASWKNMTEGHKLRHEVVKRFGDRIDVFGNGYTKIASKLDGLKDYRYSIVIENEMRDGWITEKAIDCYRTGTIPIYWYSSHNPLKKIHDIFDRCYVEFYNIDELDALLHKATDHFYFLCNQQIKFNFETAKQYTIPEDWLWHNFFKPLNLV